VRSTFVCVLCLGAVACQRAPSDGAPASDTAGAARSSDPSAPRPTPSSATHGNAKPVAVTWNEPSNWKRLEVTSPMRSASYEVSPEAGDPEPADFGVFYFGPDRPGVVERNVARWIEQFEGIDKASVKDTSRELNGLTQRIIEIEAGTYKSGMPGGPTTPKPGFAMLGAIVTTPAGSHFFKLVGPKNTVSSQRKRFFELLDSVHPK